ncbi:MAG: adenylyltransferase/cytidyltransferase family protein [Phycisphaerae bacterium]|nr:adenylyltransferase/cytidyltransferase family protein [Phycisphaerae bacterium]
MTQNSQSVVVQGAFDDIRFADIRFLQEASRFGPLTVLLASDALCRRLTGQPPKFPQAERSYTIQSIRCVEKVHLIDEPIEGGLPSIVEFSPSVWAVREGDYSSDRQSYCSGRGIDYRVIRESELAGFPEWKFPPLDSSSRRKKVMVTGCFDWFHSGHVRFFEECSELGDLIVVVGHDQNLRELKGPEHPLFGQDQRRYMVGAVRFVHLAVISTGHGWMDAEPEVIRLRPDIYAVNEDGDKPVKREFCNQYGIEYVVLKRLPKPGLERRSSTNLRGF